MINIEFENNKLNEEDIYYSEDSLLIIGKGDSEYKNTKIIFPKSINQVEQDYGLTSQLTIAYKEAIKIGAKDVFICNCFRFTDYIDILDLIAQNNFSYICPLFDFSTTFIDKESGRSRYLVELYANVLQDNFSNIFFTDKHAKLFEDIDSFLIRMKSINYNFKDVSFDRIDNGENFSFILNNLKEWKFANVVLAATISIAETLRSYPAYDCGDVVFDITNEDLFDHEMIFHSYNHLTGTTLDNLQNYNKKNNAEKMLLISIIKNKIQNSLDYDVFTGNIINAYTKIQIENYTQEVLESFIGELIEGFEIIKISYEKVGPGQININIYLSIDPYNSIESINMKVEV